MSKSATYQPPSKSELELMRVHLKVLADLIQEDQDRGINYVPIFDSLDKDIETAEIHLTGNSIARARQLSSQMANS